MQHRGQKRESMWVLVNLALILPNPQPSYIQLCPQKQAKKPPTRDPKDLRLTILPPHHSEQSMGWSMPSGPCAKA
jgi:hypothetical protein